MRDFLETTALLGVVIVLAVLVLVSIVSASILASDSTSAFEHIDLESTDNDLAAGECVPARCLGN
jgi:hypothetical protein